MAKDFETLKREVNELQRNVEFWGATMSSMEGMIRAANAAIIRAQLAIEEMRDEVDSALQGSSESDPLRTHEVVTAARYGFAIGNRVRIAHSTLKGRIVELSGECASVTLDGDPCSYWYDIRNLAKLEG